MKLAIGGVLLVALASVLFGAGARGDTCANGGHDDWLEYRPAGGTQTTAQILDDVVAIARMWQSLPDGQCSPNCKAWWLRVQQYTDAFRAHGLVCTRFNCDQLHMKAVTARRWAMGSPAYSPYGGGVPPRPDLCIGELNHTD